MRIIGATAPTFTASYIGFLNGDTAAVVGGSPVVSCSADIGSPIGMYEIAIAPGDLSADNYNFNFVTGTLTIVPEANKILVMERQVDGSVAVGFSGIPTRTYLIQASSDLHEWETIGTETSDANGQVIYIDGDAPQHDSRYYRLQLVP